MNKQQLPLRSKVVVLCMVAASLGAWLLTPRSNSSERIPALADVVPKEFGQWREIQTSAALVDPTKDRNEESSFDTLYDDVLMRTYENPRGEVVLLALAYGKKQRQEFKIHRPELCYIAQGFELLTLTPAMFSIQDSHGNQVAGARMLVAAPGRVEAVSYWVRIGSIYSDSAWLTRLHIFKEGLKGNVLDGILVRASQVAANVEDLTPKSYEVQERFLAELVNAIPARASSLLVR